MSEIEVEPDRLLRLAQRLQTACAEARRLQLVTAEAGPQVTGSPELSVALDRHAEAWEWTVRLVEQQARDLAELLSGAATTYDWLEDCIAAATGR